MEKLEKNKKGKYIPWVVWYIVITVVAQYIMINYREYIKFVDVDIFILLGAPGSVNIYNGQYWGVLTNNFIHIYISQMIINIIGIIVFGYYIEKRIKFLKFSSIIVLAAIIPSIIQLNLTNQPGVGLSGINFTLFGYIISKALVVKEFRLKWINIHLFVMISIIIYCHIYNLFIEDVFRTEAMSFGFILGLLIGYLSNKNIWLQFIVLSNILLISISTLFYAPWSSEWLLFKGVEAHKSKQYKKAKVFYHKSLETNPKNDQSIKNLELLKLDELKWKAYKAHVKENYKLARKLYKEILRIDPNDEWTKEAYNELP